MSAFTIAARELRAMFLSPLAWVIAAGLCFIVALLFLLNLDAYVATQGQMDVSRATVGATGRIGVPAISVAGFILMWVVPILAMRTIAEERARGTLNLLLASPVTLTEIVVGKFLGLLVLLELMLMVFVLMPLSLALGTTIDWGHLAAVTLGTGLQFAALAALGIWCSSLTRTPAIAAVVGIVITLLLYLIDAGGQATGGVTEATRWLSLAAHGASFSEGRFSTTDVAYYLIVMFTFLTLTVRRLDADRLPH